MNNFRKIALTTTLLAALLTAVLIVNNALSNLYDVQYLQCDTNHNNYVLTSQHL